MRVYTRQLDTGRLLSEGNQIQHVHITTSPRDRGLRTWRDLLAAVEPALNPAASVG
jgi:hypothetical protein